jgi:hypothetical protein
MEAMLSMSRTRPENIVQRKGMKKEFIRTAGPSDFPRIVEVGVSSLNGDPVATYFGCTTPVCNQLEHVYTVQGGHISSN